MPKEPAPIIPAATILMLRDNPTVDDAPLEVFMVVRHHQIDFASGALVFPGGKLAKGDVDARVRGLCDGEAALSDELLSLRVAAIREAFEESGVLLAREAGTDTILPGARLDALEADRPKLDAGELGIADFLIREDLRLACDALQPYSHWITPDMMPKRFDTHFYLAEAPADHVAKHDGSESVDSVWISPRQALEEADAGKRTVIFPTRMNLEKLGESATVAEAMAAARANSIVTVEPKVVDRDGTMMLTIPAEAGYSVTEIPVSQMG